MATLETVYHDFLSLSPEERQQFRDLVGDNDGPTDEYWEAILPELEARREAWRRGETTTISAEESIARIRSMIRASDA